MVLAEPELLETEPVAQFREHQITFELQCRIVRGPVNRKGEYTEAQPAHCIPSLRAYRERLTGYRFPDPRPTSHTPPNQASSQESHDCTDGLQASFSEKAPPTTLRPKQYTVT